MGCGVKALGFLGIEVFHTPSDINIVFVDVPVVPLFTTGISCAFCAFFAAMVSSMPSFDCLGDL